MILRKALIHPVQFFILIIVGFSILNCQPEEEIVDFDFSEGLEFSADTILFDTVFTGIGSTTKRLKVYNPNQNAVNITRIELGGGSSSSYSIVINGTEPSQSEELLLLGKDSVLVLIEVFINPEDENSPYLIKDSIEFVTNGVHQDIKLVAWGQDANYIGNEIIPCNTTWTNERPYIVYSSILVDTLCQLTIEKGTQIFASKDASIYVKGNIFADGTADERIIFRNDRLDPAYENIPGQWGGIVLLEGSHQNYMNFSVIRNAVYGIRLGSPDQDTIPDIILTNTIIENMSNSGILAFTSDIYAENVLVNNCIELNVGNIAGGNYSYRHCTFANYSFNFIRQTPSFYISDNITLEDQSMIVEDVFVELSNSIVDGNIDDEILIDLSSGANAFLAINNSMLKTSITELDTLGNIINKNPKFIDPSRYDYRLDTLSPAIDKGQLIGVISDLDGNARDLLPDLGSYERIE